MVIIRLNTLDIVSPANTSYKAELSYYKVELSYYKVKLSYYRAGLGCYKAELNYSYLKLRLILLGLGSLNKVFKTLLWRPPLFNFGVYTK